MADTFQFELVSPERLLMDKQVAMVTVPGMEGDFSVLPGHAPLVSTIRPGIVEIYAQESGTAERVFLKGGLAEVRPEGLIILAEAALDPDAVDRAALDKELANLQRDLAEATTDFDRAKAETAIAWRIALQDTIG